MTELDMPSLDLTELETPFSEQEVWKTINLLPSDKAPGPDGFGVTFYKKVLEFDQGGADGDDQ